MELRVLSVGGEKLFLCEACMKRRSSSGFYVLCVEEGWVEKRRFCPKFVGGRGGGEGD